MMAVVPNDHVPTPQTSADRPEPDDEPLLPLLGREDTDAEWGERPETDDDERLHQDRPPHWEGS